MMMMMMMVMIMIMLTTMTTMMVMMIIMTIIVIRVLIMIIMTDSHGEFNDDFSIRRSEEELHNVKITHKPPEGIVDKVTHFLILEK